MYGHSEDERLANLGTIRFCVDYVYVCRDIVEVVLAKIKHYARREDNFGKGLADMVPLWRRRLLRWLSCHEDVEGELDGFYETIVSGCRQIQAHIGAGDFPELAASLMDVRDYAHAARLGISCKIEELRYSICDWNLPDKTLESRLRELLDIERSCLDGEGDIFEIDGPVSPLSFHLDDEDEFELDYDITCTITPHPSGTAVYTNFTSHM
ncbi:hypothetical protein BKA67DRAFT_564680 [Truncatella angustata]|uniref:Uncharacterized protein n=1 Tax=Truncatella angustata TaxID=152316 RepID=A0A9P8ULH6_9PEZI|nr:uncharacterized protein BKA67DRAFT_564680 [Truncatella angustata]KAH6654309.1 hypothetical protein BKA67DRAFT_564680 [Truncatella angustata]